MAIKNFMRDVADKAWLRSPASFADALVTVGVFMLLVFSMVVGGPE